MTQQILFPVGRIVQGNLYDPNTTDDTGRPLTNNQGNPRSDYFFAVAFPKEGVTDWKQTKWGAEVYKIAVDAFPSGQYQQPGFSWKVIDGDSTVPDVKGRSPVSKQGFQGNFVVRFSSGFAPVILNRDGTQQIVQKGLINPGDYVQPLATVRGNMSKTKPGVYMNHNAVAFIGHGERLSFERDYTGVGFGQGPIPQGVSATPSAGAFSQQSLAASMPQGIAPPSPTAPGIALPPGVVPQPAMLTPPVTEKMTAKANGMALDQFLALGWTKEQLIQHGYMEPV